MRRALGVHLAGAGLLARLGGPWMAGALVIEAILLVWQLDRPGVQRWMRATALPRAIAAWLVSGLGTAEVARSVLLGGLPQTVTGGVASAAFVKVGAELGPHLVIVGIVAAIVAASGRRWLVPVALSLAPVGVPRAGPGFGLPAGIPVPAPLPVPAQPGPFAPSRQGFVLVIMESVGTLPRPSGPLGAAWDRGLVFPNVIAAANVSHLAQPSILTGRDFTRGLGRQLHFPADPPSTWGFPSYFHAKGLATHLVSSQDEHWFGMATVTLAGPWSTARDSAGLDDGVSGYRDLSGTHKIRDQHTLEAAARLLDLGPSFVYLNLQDTHMPYVLADGHLGSLTLKDWFDMSDRRLAVVAAEYLAARQRNLDAVGELIAAHPDWTFLVTGDHAEVLEAGERFGHGKSLRPEEVTTFALWVGPGIPAGVIPRRISGLDLLPTTMGLLGDAVPDGFFDGVDARTAAPRTLFSSNHGTDEAGYAAYGADAWAERDATGTCTGDCTTMDAALQAHMACLAAYRSPAALAGGWWPCDR